MSRVEARGRDHCVMAHEPWSGIVCAELNIIDGETDLTDSKNTGISAYRVEEVQLLIREFYLYSLLMEENTKAYLLSNYLWKNSN